MTGAVKQWNVASCVNLLNTGAHILLLSTQLPVFHKARWAKPEQSAISSPEDIVKHIRVVAPPRIIKAPTQPAMPKAQVLTVVHELECPVCLGVMKQPIQLHVRGSYVPPA